MHHLEREEFLRLRFMFLWALLGFQAGFLNTFGFLQSERFVSHMTGIGTQVGMAMSGYRWLYAIELMMIPVFFVAGSFFSSVLTAVRLDNERPPRYGLVMLMLPLALFIGLLLAATGVFGDVDTSIWGQGKFALIFLLSAICGTQNGCFATMTKGQIRTTHLTGISTDLGTDLARAWFSKLNPKEARLIRRTNFTRLGTFAAFATGAVLSVYLTLAWHHWALVVPLLTSLAVFVAVRRFSRARRAASHLVMKTRPLRISLGAKAHDSTLAANQQWTFDKLAMSSEQSESLRGIKTSDSVRKL